MTIQLLKLDNDVFINPDKIVQVNIVNLNTLRRDRQQNHQTPQQRERMNNKNWQVSIYVRSGSNGYNPERYTKTFDTEILAQNWVDSKFGNVIINQL